VDLLDKRTTGIPGVEDVQDAVEEVLIKHGYTGIAKHTYYTGKRPDQESQRFFGVRDELKMSVNAVRVLNGATC